MFFFYYFYTSSCVPFGVSHNFLSFNRYFIARNFCVLFSWLLLVVVHFPLIFCFRPSQKKTQLKSNQNSIIIECIVFFLFVVDWMCDDSSLVFCVPSFESTGWVPFVLFICCIHRNHHNRKFVRSHSCIALVTTYNSDRLHNKNWQNFKFLSTTASWAIAFAQNL